MDDESKGPEPERPDSPLGDSRLDWEQPGYTGPRRRSRQSTSDKPMTMRRRIRRARRHLRRKWRRKGRKIFSLRNIAKGIAALVALALLVGITWVAVDLMNVDRLDIKPATAGPASQGQNIVIVGSESAPPKVDANTLDVQLVHVTGDSTSAWVIDLPRDLALPGGGTLASALQQGGAKAVATAVQSLVKVNVDHVMEVDFHGYAAVTDEIGGVEMATANGKELQDGATVEKISADPNPPGRTVETGRRYQNWVKAMMVAGLKPSLLLNPFKVLALTDEVTGNIAVENGFGSFDMVASLWHWRGLGPGRIHFLTIPQQGYTTKGPSVLTPDLTAIDQLGAALRADNLSGIGVFSGR